MSDTFYPFRDGVRALTQKFEGFMPFMPFYVDAKHKITYGSKTPHYKGRFGDLSKDIADINLNFDLILTGPANYLVNKIAIKPLFDSFLHRYITGVLFFNVTFIDAIKDYVVLPIATKVKNLIAPSQEETDGSENGTIYQNNGVPEGFSL